LAADEGARGVWEGRRPSLGRRGCASACRGVARDARARAPARGSTSHAAGGGRFAVAGRGSNWCRRCVGGCRPAGSSWVRRCRPGAVWLTRPRAGDVVGRSACSPERSGCFMCGPTGEGTERLAPWRRGSGTFYCLTLWVPARLQSTLGGSCLAVPVLGSIFLLLTPPLPPVPALGW